MAKLQTCSSCNGFLPPGARVCPHCQTASSEASGKAARGIGGKLLAVASSGAMAITLMACYGAAPCDGNDCNSCTDNDGDGFAADTATCADTQIDCDDTTPSVYPGAPDPFGDNTDQNCDGVDGIAGMSSSSSGGGMGGMAGAGGMGGAGGN